MSELQDILDRLILPAGSPRPLFCLYEDCSRPTKNRGLCNSHYKQWHKKYGGNGIPRGPDHWQWKGGRTIRRDGYVYLNGVTLEHRKVMEEQIGRPLLKGEEVHHKNGIRHDNRIENLELWVKSQPSGSRPDDLVHWAKEIIARYA